MSKTKILFIHHSTGANLIKQGKLRKHIYAKSDNVEFWDHNYNLIQGVPLGILKYLPSHKKGLSDQDGNLTGTDYQIHLNNNNPVDYEKIFSKDPEKDVTLRQILQYDVIIFKKCYPTSQIESDEQLEEYMRSYLAMREVFNNHSNKQFLVVTQPPLRSELTNPEKAQRARKLAHFLISENFSGRYDNIEVFDFFDLLADNEGKNANMLKRNYCKLLWLDSHPNRKANKELAPKFADFISTVILA